MTYLPDDLAVKMDRMSMAHSLEARSPFLDTALIERSPACPRAGRSGSGVSSRSCGGRSGTLLPREIWNRRKHGFGVPMGTWFRGELGELFEDEVLAPGARVSGLLDPPTALGLRGASRWAREHGFWLWTVLTLERWLRTLERPLDLEPPSAGLDLALPPGCSLARP